MKIPYASVSLLVVALLGCDSSQKSGVPSAVGSGAPVALATSEPVVSNAAPSVAAPAPSAASAPNGGAAPAAVPARAVYDWADDVTLTGTLNRREVMSARGGTIKTPFLVLDEPIGIRKGRPQTNESEVTGARELWIGNVRDEKGKVASLPESLYGTKVTFQGHLQTEDTGHHHSHPWLDGKIGPSTSGAGTSTNASAKKVSPTAKAIDTSDWKGAPPGSTLDLRWTIDQARATPPIVMEKIGPKGIDNPQGDMTKHKVPLNLVLTLDGKKHSLSFEANGGSSNLKNCSGVSFYWADTLLLFELSRAEGGKAVITKADIRGKGEQVYAFDLPADVKVAQEVVLVDPSGKRSSRTCTAASLP